MRYWYCKTFVKPFEPKIIVKFQNPFLFCIILAVSIFFHKKNAKNDPIVPIVPKEFKLVLERGAFHYDCFELTPEKISYFPDGNIQHDIVKYNTISVVKLDSSNTLQFFHEIETNGFWNLKNQYNASSSCTSQLKITLHANGKNKTILCDDFERGCPELIKYIDKKVVELEGNDLKRIYLPG